MFCSDSFLCGWRVSSWVFWFQMFLPFRLFLMAPGQTIWDGCSFRYGPNFRWGSTFLNPIGQTMVSFPANIAYSTCNKQLLVVSGKMKCSCFPSMPFYERTQYSVYLGASWTWKYYCLMGCPTSVHPFCLICALILFLKTFLPTLWFIASPWGLFSRRFRLGTEEMQSFKTQRSACWRLYSGCLQAVGVLWKGFRRLPDH